jgi:hypothetical protein
VSVVLSSRVRRATHGKHVCFLCRCKIDAGSRYNDARIADQGTVYTVREHLACIDFMHSHPDYWDSDEGWDCETFANVKSDHAAGLCGCPSEAVES